jgi:hypothetical protein
LTPIQLVIVTEKVVTGQLLSRLLFASPAVVVQKIEQTRTLTGKEKEIT